MGVRPGGSGGGGGDDATILTRSAGSADYSTLDGDDKVTGGLFAGFTAWNPSFMTVLSGDGTEETLTPTKGVSSFRLSDSIPTWWAQGFGLYLQVMGDYEIVVQMRMTGSFTNLFTFALAAWETDSGLHGQRMIQSGKGINGAGTHNARVTFETSNLINVDGAAIVPASDHWYRLKRDGSAISMGQSDDNVTWVDTYTDRADVVGNACNVGLVMGAHVACAAADYSLEIKDLQMTYTPPS